MLFQVLFSFILSAFYIIYFAKMLMLKKQGIQGNILGKGKKPRQAIIIEWVLRLITLVGAAIQFISVVFMNLIWSLNRLLPIQIIGVALGFAGTLFFVLSITVMRNNWRAGFDEGQNTELVTGGVYKISRNPAFVGFDLIYIGCALTFPNIINIAVSVMAVATFHLQILNEEKFLEGTFSQAYLDYKTKVRRYL